MAEVSREMTREGQEIGDLPEVVDNERRNSCRNSFSRFCKTYFSEIFELDWSEDHIVVIRGIENAVLNGELQAIAMPRGSGKTTLLLVAVMWAILYGHRKFIVLIASNAERAEKLLKSLKFWFESNELLYEDFPEVCFPVRKLERIASRQNGQKYHGVHTRMQWTSGMLVLPTIEGSVSSGSVISCCGMTGSEIRGQQHARDKVIDRPDLVLIDDPQTRMSAKSDTQNQEKLDLLAGDVLGMAGPGKSIAGLLACTVIYAGDMADKILNPKGYPDWRGKRTKMCYAFPKNENLWEEYRLIREESFANGGNGEEATEFYRQHQAAMDEGAIVAWPSRYDRKKEISAVQNIMNLLQRDRAAFYSEYQNEPLDAETVATMATVDEILGKTNGLNKDEVASGSSIVTMFVDVHEKLLYWMVCCWKEDFSGSIMSYGTWPEVHSRNFQMKNVSTDMRKYTGIEETEGALYACLDELLVNKLEQEYFSITGVPYRINRVLVDANWSQMMGVVYEVCRKVGYSARIIPSHGEGVTTANRMFNGKVAKNGERKGVHWLLVPPTPSRPMWNTRIDVNFWKTFVHSRLKTAMGNHGCLSINGTDPRRHALLAEHLTAEECHLIIDETTEKRHEEWKDAKWDNHWFDCLVGNCVAASQEAITLPSMRQQQQQAISLSQAWSAQ